MANFCTNDLNSSLPSVTISLLYEFEDVFPKEILDGVPPITGIEHQIDFIRGESLPKHPTYRTNPNDTIYIES